MRYGHRGRYGAPLLLFGFRRSLTALVVGGAVRLAWRYRSELAPLATGVAVALCGGWAHLYHPGWWLPLLGGTGAGTAALAALPARWRWVRRRPLLGRPAERVYAAGCVLVGGGWLSAAVALGPTSRPLPLLGMLGTLVCAVPWWGHHRRRERVRVSRAVEAWPGIAEDAGLAGSRVTSAVVDAWGWTARVALRRGQTAQTVVNATAALESGLGARPGAVRVEADPVRADRAIVRVVEIDPHAAPIPYPTPDGRRRSITAPVTLGLFEDGSLVRVLLLHRNALVGGIVGAGKSGVLNVILAALAACLDVKVWGVDLKGGMELAPWLRCLDRLAITPGQAVLLLQDAVEVLEARAAHLAQVGQRLWAPSPRWPAIVVVIDEYAELPDEAGPYADSIARRGRAVAVTLLVATQRPTQQAMKNGAVRSQMDVRVCLRVRERRDVDLVLGQGMHAIGWHADALDAPGKFLVSAPEHTVPRRARAFHLTDAGVDHIAAMHARTRHPIPPPVAPPATAPVAEPAVPTPREATPDNDDAASPEDALLRALRDAPEGGTPVAALIKATGKYRTWVYQRLQEHARDGGAVQTRRGYWRAEPPTDE